jgi:hypothetical protein
MVFGILLGITLQTGVPAPPAEWIAHGPLSTLEASGPNQVVKVPVIAWDPATTPAAPDNSFSFNITGSDKDTYKRTLPMMSTEFNTFAQGITITALPSTSPYRVSVGTSGFANGVFTWTCAGLGIYVNPKKPCDGFVSVIVPEALYLNRYSIDDMVYSASILNDDEFTVEVQISRPAYSKWKEGPIRTR